GVVDHDVDSAMRLHDLGEQRVHIGFLAHIGGRPPGRPALPADLRGDALQPPPPPGRPHRPWAPRGGDLCARAAPTRGGGRAAGGKLFDGSLCNAVSPAMSPISIRYSGEVILVTSTMVEVGSGDLDSERFRSTPRTFGRFRYILSLR